MSYQLSFYLSNPRSATSPRTSSNVYAAWFVTAFHATTHLHADHTSALPPKLLTLTATDLPAFCLLVLYLRSTTVYTKHTIYLILSQMLLTTPQLGSEPPASRSQRASCLLSFPRSNHIATCQCFQQGYRFDLRASENGEELFRWAFGSTCAPKLLSTQKANFIDHAVTPLSYRMSGFVLWYRWGGLGALLCLPRPTLHFVINLDIS